MQELISTSEINEMLAMLKKLSSFIEKRRPEKDLIGRASTGFNDTCWSYFHEFFNSRQK